MTPPAEIALTALDNLHHVAGIRAKWLNAGGKDYDGKTEIMIHGKKETFFIVVKKDIRNHHLPALIALADRHKPLMIIAQKLYPAIKTEFRKHNIAYADTAGNMFIKTDQHLILIDGQKQIPVAAEKTGRAFTKTGLKVLFHFLINEDLINAPYRTIAETTGTALGNVNIIINGLKEQGFIKNLDDKRFMLVNKSALLDRWITGFTDRLKPTLQIGHFRFINSEAEKNWETIQFNNTATQWGSEPAAAMITKYLHPEIFTIYTDEPKNDMMKNYRFVPDINGNIRIFRMFWKPEIIKSLNTLCVPPLLIYADLIITGDPRNMETAQKIYKRYVQPILK